MTNQTAGADDARTAQEPLGSVLVRRGLITPEQLEAALAEQKASGDPLGKIVVSLGYATPAIIAQALATQHGGLLKTEYGFATGFGAGAASPALVSEPPVSAQKAAPIDNRPAFSEPTRTRDEALREELALASAQVEKLRDDNDRLAKLRSELEQRLAGETQRAAALERELEAVKARPAVPAGDDPRVGELEAAVASRDAMIEEFHRTGEGWKSAIAERDAAIGELVAARDEALRRLAAADAAPAVDVDGISAARDAALAQVDALRRDLESVRGELVAARDEALRRLAAADAAPAVDVDGIAAARDAALAQVDALRTELGSVRGELGAVRAELAAQVQAVEAVGSADELADRDRAIAELTAARDAALADLRRAKGELAERDAKLPELLRERDAAVSRLAEKDAELTSLASAQAREADAAIAKLEAALADREAQLSSLVASHAAAVAGSDERAAALVEERDTAFAERDAVPAPRWSQAERHLLFFQGAEGYELVERTGPPPAVGEQVDVPGGCQHVMRLAASPAPGSDLPCAYLISS